MTQEFIANETEQINLAVAAIAGWTNIQLWDEKNAKRTFIGTNEVHPELGIFLPNYCESLDAITKVFDLHNINWAVDSNGFACKMEPYVEVLGETPSIALCKLLLELNPKPIAKAHILEVSFG
jgi:hypothetical protein